MGKLRIITPYGRPWALTSSVLIQMCEAYDRHAEGAKFDMEGLQSAVDKLTADMPSAATAMRSGRDTGGQGYEIQDGVAIVDVDGILAKGMNLFMLFCGGTSTEMLQRDINAAADDPSVHSIVLRIDSPGGSVDGTQLAADAVRAAIEKKPVVAWVTGCGCSAAYWIAAAAQKVYLADSTTQVGSIGVLMTHTDRSGADAQKGVKRTEVTAGKYKRVGSDTGPLSDTDRGDIQGKLDYLYSIFMPTVAGWRGMDPQVMHDTAADGRVLIGQQAIDAGLADGIITLPALIAQLNEERTTGVSKTAASASAIQNTGEVAMFTQEQLDAAVATARTEGHTAGLAAGAQAELARIKAVHALRTPTNKAIVEAAMLDGTSTAEQAALKIVAADKEAREKAGEDMNAEAPKPAPGTVVDPVSKPAADEKKDAEKSEADPSAISAKAKAYKAEQAKAGKTISIAEAVEHVSKQK